MGEGDCVDAEGRRLPGLQKLGPEPETEAAVPMPRLPGFVNAEHGVSIDTLQDAPLTMLLGSAYKWNQAMGTQWEHVGTCLGSRSL